MSSNSNFILLNFHPNSNKNQAPNFFIRVKLKPEKKLETNSSSKNSKRVKVRRLEPGGVRVKFDLFYHFAPRGGRVKLPY